MLFKRKTNINQHIGLYLNQQTISLVQLQADKIGYFSQIHTSSDYLVKHLKQLLLELKPSARHAAIAVQDDMVVNKVINFDSVLSSHEIELQLKTEMQRYISLTADEVYFDFHPLEVISNSRQIHLIATRKSAIDPMIQLLVECGLNTNIIDIASHALSRAINHLSTLPNNNVVIFIFDEALTLIALKQKIPVLSHQVEHSLPNLVSIKNQLHWLQLTQADFKLQHLILVGSEIKQLTELSQAINVDYQLPCQIIDSSSLNLSHQQKSMRLTDALIAYGLALHPGQY